MDPTVNHEDEDDTDPSEALPLPLNAPNYMTPRGHARLSAELEHLLRTERPSVVEIVAWAASNGDRSENGDYLYGKRRLREIDRRIRFLSKHLEIAQIVDPRAQSGNDQIFFGAQVTVQEGTDCFTYTIVGRDETDPNEGHISWISPLARALLKKHAGDCVRFMSPSGWRTLEILDVQYLPIEPLPS
ncbi:MAG: transcription elongation factor GreB [Betaproteobacteria bacterium]|jgi:transcription elongation factor GreB|nr:transcription elongation factor GreB [Betaproteobacteria bacterium]